MIAAVIILLIILIMVVLYHITYRRQVRGLVRQLAFLNEHESAMRPGVELSDNDLGRLAEEIDKMNEKCKAVKLECLNEDTVLRQTITNISHDIRTPLTSLDGYFQLLAEPNLDEERKLYYLGIIRERISNLNSMLDELFTYARLQDHNYEIELTKTDLTAITADIIMSFYEDILKTGAEPVIELCEEPVFINGNKEALCRIEQNIIKNALMHGKNLKITLKKITGNTDAENLSEKSSEKSSEKTSEKSSKKTSEKSSEKTSEKSSKKTNVKTGKKTSGKTGTEMRKRICFECSNELQNPDADIDIGRVFERFYKADASRSSKGSGLGMAIAKELTERNAGTVSATFDEKNKSFSVRAEFDIM